MYGPRTLIIIARPKIGSDKCTISADLTVEEYVLVTGTDTTTTSTNNPSSNWVLCRENITIADCKKIIAPANARCTVDNPAYRSLMLQWLEERYTIRYTGGMVPDVHHILVKGGGVFCSPASPLAPAKLRVLYECLPLALIMEAAGGESMYGKGGGRMLEVAAKTHTDRSAICLGSRDEVERCRNAMMMNM